MGTSTVLVCTCCGKSPVPRHRTARGLCPLPLIPSHLIPFISLITLARQVSPLRLGLWGTWCCQSALISKRFLPHNLSLSQHVDWHFIAYFLSLFHVFSLSFGVISCACHPHDQCMLMHKVCGLSRVSSLELQDLELEENLKQGENLGSGSIHEREMEEGATPGNVSQKEVGRSL